MKVLLTGVTGICGKHLLPLLLQDKNITKIVGITRKTRHEYYECSDKYIECYCQLDSPLYVMKLLSNFKPDIIFNLAAISTSNSNPLDIWKNTNITLNLLEYSKERKTKFVQASSIVIENYPLNLYATSKLSSECLLESYKQIYSNITGFSFRTCAIVGTGNQHGLLKDVIKKVLAEGNIIELFGNEPGSIKPYISAIELAYIINDLYKGGFYNNANYPWIISPQDSISVKQVAEIVMNITNKRKNIIWNSSKTWVTDQLLVTAPLKHHAMGVLPSTEAIKRATQHILREEYSDFRRNN